MIEATERLASRTTTHAMQCMEVWGGNRAISQAVTMPGLDAWVFSRPYKDQASGGDIHYLSSCATGRISRLFVADVSGHGLAVSELAVKLRRLLVSHANYLDQTRFVKSLNRGFASLADGGGFATAVVATYWAPTDYLTACNAGHPKPLWFRAESREWQFLEQEAPRRVEGLANLPLGVAEPTAYEQFGVRLTKGDLVIIYTDSLIEAFDAKGAQLGEQGLLSLVRRLDANTPDRLIGSLLEAVASYTADAPLADDLTVLVLRHNASRPPRQSFGETAASFGRFAGMVWRSMFGGDPAPWPEARLETIGGAVWSRLNRRWGGGKQTARD